jgi:outer membrane protein assembly factor BamB
MRKRLLWIGGGLAVLAVVAAGVGYLLYSSGAFRSTDTERGETLSTNEAEAPETPVAPRRPARASWPYFRYGELRDGVNPGAVARPPFNVRWSHRVPRNGYLEAPAVVSDGILVYGSYGKRFGSDLFARDGRTGRLLWRKHYRHGSNFAGSAGVYRGTVYITSHDGNLRAYRLKTGKLRFRKKIAAAESPPIGRDGLVYFGDGPKGGDGRFRAVDWRTGRTRWSFKARGTISSGAALTRSTLYFASYGGEVYALNRFTGKLRWRTAVRGPRGNTVPFYSTPALGQGRLVVGGLDGSIYALDAQTGSQRWRHDGDGYVYGSAAIWRGRVFIGDFGGGFHALSLKSGRRLWKRKIGPIIGSPTVMAGYVYISSLRPARTYAYVAATGAQVWRFQDGQFSPLIADGRQVWLTGKAHVYGLAERRPPPRGRPGRASPAARACMRRRTASARAACLSGLAAIERRRAVRRACLRLRSGTRRSTCLRRLAVAIRRVGSRRAAAARRACLRRSGRARAACLGRYATRRAHQRRAVARRRAAQLARARRACLRRSTPTARRACLRAVARRTSSPRGP